MDSAKNKKSSSDGFKQTVVSAPANVGFRLPDHYWKALESDPGFREEWERRMAQAVERISEETRARVRAEYTEVFRKEGFEAGIVEARAAIGASLGELQTVCQSVLNEKARLLEDHEAKWCHALVHLLRRFLVPCSEYSAGTILDWLRESTSDWSKTAVIRVLVSKDSAGLLSSLVKAAGAGEGSWVFEVDEQLAPGEIRCESSGIGISFEPGKELQKVEAMVEQVLRGNTVEMNRDQSAEAERNAA